MLSGATWCFESIGLVHSVIGGGRDVVCDNRWQHDQVPMQAWPSLGGVLRAEMHWTCIDG